MSKMFIVFGTQGAGKTTVLKGIKSARVVNMGDEMFTAYSRKFGITSRDQMRSKSLQNYEYMVDIRNGILKHLTSAQGTLVIDTHATVKKGDGYEVGLSADDLRMLKGKVKAILYIDASNAQILARRKKDATMRKREEDTEEELVTHRNMNLTFTALFALHLEVPIYLVQNPDGKLKSTQKRIEEILKTVK